MSDAERIAVELDLGEERRLAIEWDRDAVASLASGPEGADDGSAVPWRATPEIEWGPVTGLRVLTAGFEDGTLLAYAAARPAGTEAHGDEISAAVLARSDGEPQRLAEVLLSTEYGADGRARRIGAELYGEPDAYPMRLAADTIRSFRATSDDADRAVAVVEARLDGAAGLGIYELLSPPSSA